MWCPGLTNVPIPDSVTSFGDYAFYGCESLTDVTIPDSVTSIGREALDTTGWYASQPVGLVYAGKVAYRYKGTMPAGTSIIMKPGTKGIASLAFSNDENLTGVTIPDSVTNIGTGAFYNCRGLSSVIIPDNVTSIGDDAFSRCAGLVSFTIPAGVTSIGRGAFSACGYLTSVAIPGSVTSIGYGAFSGCGSLTSVTLPESVTNIWQDTFSGCSSLTSVTIPCTVTSIGYGAFSGCDNLTIFGVSGSYAETIAGQYDIPFIPIGLFPATGSTCIVQTSSNLIYGLEPGTTKQQFTSNLVQVTAGYSLLFSPETIGTGTRVTVRKDADGIAIAAYTILIFGDVNGDGNIDTADAGSIVDYENFLVEWDPAENAAVLKAADLNGDGNVDTIDAGLIVDVENFLLTVNQTTGLAG